MFSNQNVQFWYLLRPALSYSLQLGGTGRDADDHLRVTTFLAFYLYFLDLLLFLIYVSCFC